MKQRRHSILKAIIQYFISTAHPIGSKTLQQQQDLEVSAATIRNEMAALEKSGFLTHPHTSAGRIPTAHGYRFYVDDLEISENERSEVFQDFSLARDDHYREKAADQRVFDAIAILTKVTPNIAFATVPSSKRMFFLGLSQVLEQPEFSEDLSAATKIVKVLEEDLYNALENMEISQDISLFIGPEIVVKEMEFCSLLAFEFDVLGKKGKIGILGPMRMPYKRNILALEAARSFLGEKFLDE